MINAPFPLDGEGEGEGEGEGNVPRSDPGDVCGIDWAHEQGSDVIGIPVPNWNGNIEGGMNPDRLMYSMAAHTARSYTSLGD